MTKYRIKQIDTHYFCPQIKSIFGYWRYIIISDCHYAGCYNTRASFDSRDKAAEFLEKRVANIAKEKERRRRIKEDYPKYFDWP